MKLETHITLVQLVLEYALYLALIYITLFVLSNALLEKRKIKYHFQFITIMLSMVIVIYYGLLKLFEAQFVNDFWTLMILGNVIALAAEVILFSYKLLVLRHKLDKQLLLAHWYHDMKFSRAIAETLAYGMAVSIPIAYFIAGGTNWIAIGIFLVFIGLFFLRRKYPISTLFPGWNSWMK